MQLSNAVVRLDGSQLNTVYKKDVTPAEILVLKRLHGDDAVVDIRPTRVDRNRRHQSEFERLQHKYDRASTFVSTPGEEHKSVMASLFPGAMRKLPLTLEEIGLGHLMSDASIEAADRGAASEGETSSEGETEVFAPAAEEVEPDVEQEPPTGFGGFGAGNLAE